MRKLLSIPLALLASSALAQGFTPKDLSAAAQVAKSSAAHQRQELDAETERLRLAIAYDAAAGIGIREEGEQALLATALGTGSDAGDLRARWFMAGAISQGGSGDQTLLYNPLARGWLILNWEREPTGNWLLEAARIASSAPSDWAGIGGPYLAAFVNDYAVSSARAGNGRGGGAAMEANRWIAGVATWMHDPLRRSAAEDTRSLIILGQTAKFGGGNIDLMPDRARATYSPVAGFDRQAGGHSLLYGSPLFPQLLIAADFDGGAVPKLGRLTLINLDNAGKGNAR